MRDVSILTNQLTSNAAIESWFIQNEMLQGYSFNLEWDAPKFSNQIVIYLEIGEIDLNLIASLKERGNKVILCQMGDELKIKYNRDAYIACDFNIRNYYFPEIFEDPQIGHKSMWIPNGYKSGVGPRDFRKLRSADQRHFLSSFLGWLKNDASFGDERNKFAAIAEQCTQDLLLQPTNSFAQGFNPGLYSAVLEHSVFCPCPAGNSPETIRLYDALENGCIPISLKHAFLQSEHALGQVPFPLLDDWTELPAFFSAQRQGLASSPKLIVDMQKRCMHWWNNHKNRLKNNICAKFLDLSL